MHAGLNLVLLYSIRMLNTQNQIIRVMLVDDHAVVRAGYKRFIELNPEIRVTAEATTGEEAYELIKQIQVDVVILDLSMPGQGGFETLRKIMNRFPKQKVLVFTMHENASTANQVLKIGASGYLTKSMNPELIVQAIHDVWRGGTPIEEGIASALTDLQNNSNPHDNLLPREYEVFLLLSAGESVDLICSKLNMSSRTVFNYQTTILKKMNLFTQIEFNHYALRHQLIQSSP